MTGRISHGSPAGFADGCRTRSSCPNGELSPWLSCAEASVRRRSDYRMWQLPLDQPIPRDDAETPGAASAAPSSVSTESGDGSSSAHGTLGGYRRGCHVDSLCPHWGAGRITCAAARRKYIRDYRARRLHEKAESLPHGTPYGYYLGCRDRRTCPGDESGTTCSDAQSTKKREAAAAAGIPARTPVVSATPAVERVRQLRSAGYSLRQIARLAGCGHTTIADLARTDSARRSQVTPDTLQRILALQPA